MEAALGRALQSARSAGLVVALFAVVLAIYWQTTWSMVQLWRNSDTYSHCFLIVPAFLWLVWQRRFTLALLPASPSWLGLIVLAGLGLGWLSGNLAAANAPTQFALIAMLPAALATVLGVRWVRALGFPLAFLFLAVPFGDALVPAMMDWTADFAVAALKLSGVPVYREGAHFSIPSGDWSVVEACSGIRYLFACVTVATLYAWTFYRSTARRLLFVVGAIAIAIIANWIRAYGIVMVAHLSDHRIATGVDHVLAGGLFFGLIVALMFWLGTFWREDHPDRPAAQRRVVGAGYTAPITMTSRPFGAAIAVVVVLSVWPLVSLGTEQGSRRAPWGIGDIEPREGWVRVKEPAASWQPRVANPSVVQLQTFVKGGQRVSVYFGVFDRPSQDSKLTASVNQLVDSQDRRWKLVERGMAELQRHGESIPIRTGTLVGRATRVVVWHWYWVDGTLTKSAARVVVAQMLARLRGRSESAAWVNVFTTDDGSTTSAPIALEAFLLDMLDPIEGALRSK